MAQDLNQEEVLIARNNETGKVGAVTGLNKDGTPKMTDVKSAYTSHLNQSKIPRILRTYF